MKVFHVKEPLYIFFYDMNEMSEFCKSHDSFIAGSQEC